MKSAILNENRHDKICREAPKSVWFMRLARTPEVEYCTQETHLLFHFLLSGLVTNKAVLTSTFCDLLPVSSGDNGLSWMIVWDHWLRPVGRSTWSTCRVCNVLFVFATSRHFHPLEFVGRVSETQIKVGENLDYISHSRGTLSGRYDTLAPMRWHATLNHNTLPWLLSGDGSL